MDQEDEASPDVMVAVMGTTGTEKSTFIRLLTNDDEIHMGHDLASETVDIRTAHYVDQETGRTVMLVSIPDFGDSSESVTDTDILEKIVFFLEPEEGESRKFNGIIYMYRISDPLVDDVSCKNLSRLRLLCGEICLSNIRIVTTNWSCVTEQEGDEREVALQRGIFKSLVDSGTMMRRHSNTAESARQIVSEFISFQAMTLQVQDELRKGKSLADTSIGANLSADVRETQRKCENELGRLKKKEEAAPANNHGLSVELAGERSALEQKISHASGDTEKLNKTLEQLRSRPPGYFPPRVPLSRHSSGKQKEESTDVHVPNIIIYGESGVGKSSIINLVAGQNVAFSSIGAVGCTFQHERHPVLLDGKQYALWDTTGLDEAAGGTIPATLSENYLRSLMQALARQGGLHLLLYCIRAGRITQMIKHNYDLFYVTVCRKKVPIALVVTGLEHQEGNMETWWTANEASLREYGMRFDDHACVTTLNIQSYNMEDRLSASRNVLCELLVKYSALPAWKIDPSFTSAILPMFRASFRRTPTRRRSVSSAALRKVIICDMERASSDFIRSSDATNLTKSDLQQDEIGGRLYEFIYVDKHVLQLPTPKKFNMSTCSEAGLLVFCTSLLGNAAPSPEEFRMLDVFYGIAGGQTRPMIVLLQGCDDEGRAIREFWSALASYQSNVQAFPTTPSNFPKMIEQLFIDHIEVKTLSPSCLWRWVVKNWERWRHSRRSGC